jgi:hypothetical protein
VFLPKLISPRRAAYADYLSVTPLRMSALPIFRNESADRLVLPNPALACGQPPSIAARIR